MGSSIPSSVAGSLDLRQDQEIDVRRVLEVLEDEDKCTLVRFCGTGKSRIAAALLRSVTVSWLVVPWISLVDQFDGDVLRRFRDDRETIILVSSEHVTAINDIVRLMRVWLRKAKADDSQRLVVVFMYQSHLKVLDAVGKIKDERIRPELVVFDEAHNVGTENRARLFRDDLFGAKRVFLTATPRSDGVKAELSSAVSQSSRQDKINMFDELEFGRMIRSMSCRKAIDSGIITDYQLLISFYGNGRDLLEDESPIGPDTLTEPLIRTIARSLADRRLPDGTFPYRRVLLFHRYADRTTESGSSVQQYRALGDEFAKHLPMDAEVSIRGLTSSSTDRADILQWFGERESNDIRILSSCQCLKEGVDIPSADALVFADRKNSTREIVQNVGRVLRRCDGKRDAIVLVPVFCDGWKINLEDFQSQHSVIDGAVRQHRFDSLCNILSAMRQYDESVDELLVALGSSSTRNSRTTPQSGVGKQHEIGDTDEQEDETLSSSGDEDDDDGSLADAAVSSSTKSRFVVHYDPEVLGYWEVDIERVGLAMLEKVGHGVVELCVSRKLGDSKSFHDWISEIRQFVATQHRLPRRSDKPYGQWIHKRRHAHNKGWLSPSHAEALNSIDGWKWEEEDTFGPKLDMLRQYLSANGRLPKQTEKPLGPWINAQRYKYNKGELDPLHFEQLDSLLGWKWEEEDPFYINLQKVKDFCAAHDGNFPKPRTDRVLSHWIINQRQARKRGELTSDKVDALNSLEGWKWVEDDYFAAMVVNVQDFVASNGRLPKSDEKPLGHWVHRQRQKQREQSLNESQIKSLSDIPGWWWEKDPFSENLAALHSFVSANGRLPKLSECRLGHWVCTQRQWKKKGKLSPDRIAALSLVPGWYWLSESENTPGVEQSSITNSGDSLTVAPRSYQPRPLSYLSELHRTYKTLTSANLAARFRASPEEFREYHDLVARKQESWNPETVPSAIVRTRLQQLLSANPTSPRTVIDMGCGTNPLRTLLAAHPNLTLVPIDHVAVDSSVREHDISAVPMADASAHITVLCLALWGSNCHDYVREAKRLTMPGGRLLVVEPRKRWSEEGDEGLSAGRLSNVLGERGWTVVNKSFVGHDAKFIMFECVHAL